jgi:type II secretory pathway component PulF
MREKERWPPGVEIVDRVVTNNGSRSIELADLIALNDEIVALVRAGVPLGRGLTGVGGDLHGRLGALAKRLGARLDEGSTLPYALEAEGNALPSVYRSIVEAGMRAGRLPAALEGLATFARSLSDLRSTIGLSLIYPLSVLSMSYALFVGFVVFLAPRLRAAFDSLRLPHSLSARWLERVGELAPYWVPTLPIIGLMLWLLWLRSGRASVLDARRLGFGLSWIPGMYRLIQDARASLFSDLTAVLLDNGVPLADAVQLAGRSAGTNDKRLQRLTDSIRSGGQVDVQAALTVQIGWILSTGREQGGLSAALRKTADRYRQQAESRAELIRAILPAALVVVIGGAAALAFGLTLYIPFTRLLKDIAL